MRLVYEFAWTVPETVDVFAGLLVRLIAGIARLAGRLIDVWPPSLGRLSNELVVAIESRGFAKSVVENIDAEPDDTQLISVDVVSIVDIEFLGSNSRAALLLRSY